MQTTSDGQDFPSGCPSMVATMYCRPSGPWLEPFQQARIPCVGLHGHGGRLKKYMYKMSCAARTDIYMLTSTQLYHNGTSHDYVLTPWL
ncbi:unnamed protein product [Urochloa humidicola]